MDALLPTCLKAYLTIGLGHHVLSMIIAIEIEDGLAEDQKKTVTVSLHQTCLHNVMDKLLVKQLHLLVLKQLLLMKHRKLLMMQIVVKNITDNRKMLVYIFLHFNFWPIMTKVLAYIPAIYLASPKFSCMVPI